MAIFPVYCPEDPGGPLSPAEAIKLVELMRQRANELIAANQEVGRGSDSTFHHAGGQEQALAFALDLLGRLTPDPSQVRAAFTAAAEALEQQAADLRRRAEAPGVDAEPTQHAQRSLSLDLAEVATPLRATAEALAAEVENEVGGLSMSARLRAFAASAASTEALLHAEIARLTRANEETGRLLCAVQAHREELARDLAVVRGESAARSRRGVYIASKARHAPQWLALRASGLPVISTWIDEAGEGESASLADLWSRCVAESASAAALLFYHEPGDEQRDALIEIGAALASGVPVFVVGDPPGSWVHHALVTRCVSLDEAVEAVRALAAPVPQAAPVQVPIRREPFSLVPCEICGDSEIGEAHMSVNSAGHAHRPRAAAAPAPREHCVCCRAPQATVEESDALPRPPGLCYRRFGGCCATITAPMRSRASEE